jgi:rhodanese-related sulfurtransferase
MILIDVRTETEFSQDGIKGSLNIPMHLVPENYDKIRSLECASVFFYCRSGNRSGWVLDYFSQRGMTKIFNGGSVQQMLDILSKFE